MAVISIEGAPGVGKSYLAKQLASLEELPVFFEGEEGTLPMDILQNLFQEETPHKRFAWFMERYRNHLEKAHVISAGSMDCYVDGGPTLFEGYIRYEDHAYHQELETLLPSLQKVEPHLTVIVIADKERIREGIVHRQRDFEQQDIMVERSLSIQEHIQDIARARDRKHMVLDRSKLDFHNGDHLLSIQMQIRSMLRA